MGALLSLPLLALPSVATLWSVAASCCGAATCSALCSACGKFRSSIATRIAYAVILLVNSILAWIMLTDWAIKKLQKLTLNYMSFDCGSSKCYGFFGVQRINFALGLFHLILAVLLIGVTSTRNPRAGLQNGYWGPKIIVWALLVVLSFFIPEGWFMFWGRYVAFAGAILFVLLGLILLVDLAYVWAETCNDKREADNISDTERKTWLGLLVGSTLFMYVAALVMTIVMYYYFGRDHRCSMNISAITINMLLAIAVSVLSIHPSVMDVNPKSGLGPTAVVAFYCTYLTFSAVAMEPDDKNCNPLIRSGRGARTTTIILGAVVTMITIAYTTTRAATYGFALSSANAPGNNAYAQLSQDDNEHGLVTQQPSRREAMRAAIEAGALPASALDEDSDDEDETESKHAKDDERAGTQYNYSLFHVIFFMATCWVATLLTQDFHPEKAGDFAPVGRTYWASWIKIVSSWVCYVIYGWSLVAPAVLTDRVFA